MLSFKSTEKKRLTVTFTLLFITDFKIHLWQKSVFEDVSTGKNKIGRVRVCKNFWRRGGPILEFQRGRGHRKKSVLWGA